MDLRFDAFRESCSNINTNMISGQLVIKTKTRTIENNNNKLVLKSKGRRNNSVIMNNIPLILDSEVVKDVSIFTLLFYY